MRSSASTHLFLYLNFYAISDLTINKGKTWKLFSFGFSVEILFWSTSASCLRTVPRLSVSTNWFKWNPEVPRSWDFTFWPAFRVKKASKMWRVRDTSSSSYIEWHALSFTNVTQNENQCGTHNQQIKMFPQQRCTHSDPQPLIASATSSLGYTNWN